MKLIEQHDAKVLEERFEKVIRFEAQTSWSAPNKGTFQEKALVLRGKMRKAVRGTADKSISFSAESKDGSFASWKSGFELACSLPADVEVVQSYKASDCAEGSFWYTEAGLAKLRAAVDTFSLLIADLEDLLEVSHIMKR